MQAIIKVSGPISSSSRLGFFCLLEELSSECVLSGCVPEPLKSNTKKTHLDGSRVSV